MSKKLKASKEAPYCVQHALLASRAEQADVSAYALVAEDAGSCGFARRALTAARCDMCEEKSAFWRSFRNEAFEYSIAIVVVVFVFGISAASYGSGVNKGRADYVSITNQLDTATNALNEAAIDYKAAVNERDKYHKIAKEAISLLDQIAADKKFEDMVNRSI
jgi:hypothetical protein